MSNDGKDWSKFKEEHSTEEQSTEESTTEESVMDTAGHQAALERPTYEALEEQLTLAEQEAHKNWEKSVRALAELDNVRRRSEREVVNAHKYGLEKIITSLLPISDSLEQALQLAIKDENEAMREGLDLTMKLFLDVLQKQDVIQIDPLGAPFDPQQHEAMSIQEAPGTAPNIVLAVFQKGYMLNDRVIRPARVIVSKNVSVE